MKDLKNYLLHPIYFICFCALNLVYSDAPASISLYLASLSFGGNVIIMSIAFALSFLVYKDLFFILFGSYFALVLEIIFYIYKRFKKQMSAEIILYLVIGFLPYLLNSFPSRIVEKLGYMTVIALFYAISQVAILSIKKHLSQSISPSDAFLCCLFFILLGIGLINLVTIDFYKPIAIGICIILFMYYRSTINLLVGIVAAIPMYIVTNNFNHIIAFIVFSGVSILFYKSPTYIMCVPIVLAELLFGAVLNFYGDYGYLQAIPTFVVIFLCSLISQKTIAEHAYKYNFNTENALIKGVINRNRVDTSKRLYELSDCFFMMTESLKNLKKCTESVDVVVEKMVAQTISNMCNDCPLNSRCNAKNSPKLELVEKIIKIGINKGKISIVDLPKEFLDICTYPNSLIYEVNRLIGEYLEYIKTAETSDKSKEILSLQSLGVASLLKELAFSLSKTTRENRRDEKRIKKALSRNRIKCDGALCFGEGKDTEVELICPEQNCDTEKIVQVLNKEFSTNLTISRLERVSANALSLTLCFAPELDAVFGVSKATKDGQDSSGDCYSVVKISQSSFLVALSDGMGSGKIAKNTSETALNLIESLYKAGLDSQFIISLVNKLLSIAIDDNFTAIDIGLVDLINKDVCFIKIGSPYGFILAEDGMRYVEGSSLPLGILDDLKPTTAESSIKAGDVIVMVSDGITDAFTSSGDLIDFLKSAPLLNPQDLADSIVAKALSLTNNCPQDDMTALCVRII